MPREIELPNGAIAEFPDDMSDEQIAAVLRRQFPQQPAPAQQQTPSPAQQEKTFGDGILAAPGQEPTFTPTGFMDAAKTMASSIIAEPVAGIAGLVSAPFVGLEGAGDVVEKTREALTLKPWTKSGEATLGAVGSALEPVGKAFSAVENWAGDKVYEKTGSPALAAFAKTAPTAALEILGLKAAKMSKKPRVSVPAGATADDIAAASKAVQPSAGDVSRAVAEAAPDIDTLKDASRAVYSEINELGATVKPRAMAALASQVQKEAKSMGVNARVTPKAAGALDEILGAVDKINNGESVSLIDLDNMRKIAGNAAAALDGGDKAIGMAIVDKIDDFLDRAGVAALDLPDAAKGVNVGERYKAARQLWARARKAETIQEAMIAAEKTASGMENGLRIEIGKILKNKKQQRFFTSEEKAAMHEIVKGTKAANAAKFFGRFGFTEGRATNALMGLGGVAAGSAVGGPVGAVAVPVAGQLGRSAAQRITAGKVSALERGIRAGRSGKEIAETYLRTTPAAQRSAAELADLLVKADASIIDMPRNKLAMQAIEIAKKQRKKTLAGAMAPAAMPKDEERQ